MKFSDDQMRRQTGYTLTILALESMRKNGILTDSEYREAVSIIDAKYNPIIAFNS